MKNVVFVLLRTFVLVGLVPALLVGLVACVPDDELQEEKSKYEAVDLGLSVKWASCNVGATSPEEYGDYYAWGETEVKTNYSWSTYIWCNGGYDSQTKYCTSSDYGTVDNKVTLEPKDDVARVKWGGSWRMPTFDEIQELCDCCTWKWTSVNGVNGYKVTGTNGNSIFLPAAGIQNNEYEYEDGFDGIYDRGSYGYYWSATLWSATLREDFSHAACRFYFSADYHYWDPYDRCVGRGVRPVKEE